MGSSDIPSEREQRAFDIVGKVTGAEVVPRDGRRAPPRTPDAELFLPDGRRGWLEVSTLGVPGEVEMLNALGRTGLATPSSGNWDWQVLVTRRDMYNRARSTAPRVIEICETAGVGTPLELPMEQIAADEDLRWFASAPGVNLFGAVLPAGARSNDPTIRFQTDSILASWRFGGLSLVDQIKVWLSREPLSDRVAKLTRTDADERHLYLRVTKEGIGEHNMFTLAAYAFTLEEYAGPDVPLDAPDPDVPTEITHLWLDTEWGTRVTRWTRGKGWDHPDAPDAKRV